MAYENLTLLKKELDSFRPLNSDLVRNLETWFCVELTYTSNAIEGNTLSRKETAVIIEKGLTVGGKTLQEHLEATNHAHALDWAYRFVQNGLQTVSEEDILTLHSFILKGLDDSNAGHYRSIPVRIAGSSVVLPNPRKVPDLMQQFSQGLIAPSSLHPVEGAAEAHYQLVTIHPFVDGNGRTARLLMNLLLMMQGYPPAIIRTQDRLAYISALETAQLGGSKAAFHALIMQAVERSLKIYLKAVKGQEVDEPSMSLQHPLLTIGRLAQQVNEPVSTIRHWLHLGLIKSSATTDSGYYLFDPTCAETIKKIQTLKEKRLTLGEIIMTLESEKKS